MKQLQSSIPKVFQRVGWNLVKLTVTVGLLGWIILRFDWSEVTATIRTVPWFIIPIGFLVYISSQLFVARRLQILLNVQRIQVNYWYCVRLTFMALFCGNFLPTTVGGDAVKAVFLTRHGYRLDEVAATLVIDRLVNIVAMGFFVPSVLVLQLPLRVSLAFQMNGIRVLAGITIAAIALAAVYKLCLLFKPTKPFVLTIRNKLCNIFKTLSGITRRWFSKPLVLLRAFYLSGMSLLAAFATAWIVAKGLGIDGSFVEITAIEVIVYFVSLLPISINGLGVQEVGRLQLLTHLGALSVQALSLAVLMRLLYIGISLLGVFEFLAWKEFNKDSNV